MTRANLQVEATSLEQQNKIQISHKVLKGGTAMEKLARTTRRSSHLVKILQPQVLTTEGIRRPRSRVTLCSHFLCAPVIPDAEPSPGNGGRKYRKQPMESQGRDCVMSLRRSLHSRLEQRLLRP
ncbi:hypothetical protein NDU88_004197 [Pleurodeles waltl]|uniref:Uncharacterized protein n=1 Tax=Pleurodeles waltl TaxID=8319 RepID=A0AAV7WUU7_PLEWA|nr:hypothetical protein NDU88_004197 [Pleurodeles waltl]